jgi:hypothetical protein
MTRHKGTQRRLTMLGHTRGETSDVEMGSSLLLSRFRMSA